MSKNEIKPEDIWNEEKINGIKKLIDSQINNEYIIINKTFLLKELEELKSKCKNSHEHGDFDSFDFQNQGAYKQIEKILSQSTPLIPEIEKAFDAGNKRGWSGYPDTDNWKQPTKQEYISNLKLDI